MRIDKRITKKILGSSRDSFNRGLDDWNYVNRGFLDSEVDDLSNYKKSVLIDDKINYAKDKVLKRGNNLGLIARHGTNIVAGGGLGYWIRSIKNNTEKGYPQKVLQRQESKSH